MRISRISVPEITPQRIRNTLSYARRTKCDYMPMYELVHIARQTPQDASVENVAQVPREDNLPDEKRGRVQQVRHAGDNCPGD